MASDRPSAFSLQPFSGWGTADQGGSYGTPGSSGDFAVTGSVGQITLPITNTIRDITLNGSGTTKLQETDVLWRVAVSALPTGTNAELYATTVVRRISSGNDYRATLRIQANGSLLWLPQRALTGTVANLSSSVSVSGVTASANSFLWMRVQATGTAPTTIRMRVWADGTSEPSTWQASVTDNSNTLQTVGNVALRSFANNSVTNYPITVSADDLIVTQILNSSSTSRSIAYSYDGLDRLTGATETGATTNTYGYGYDNAGNRTSVTTNGSTVNRSYNNANQVVGWTYDQAGNLTSDGANSYTYDAFGRVTATGSTTNSYNGDDVLVAQTTSGTTTRYTQDLNSGLPVILGDGTNQYLYGNGSERLLGLNSSIQTWYASDALGSLRQTINQAGSVLGTVNYDPWGTPQTPTLTPFGFTGELQQGGNVYLRARWYQPGSGMFTARDGFAGYDEQPYSEQYYQYGYANPVSNSDPSGKCSAPPKTIGIGSVVIFEERPCVEPYLPMIHIAAQTYGVPWQIVAGILESELEIDTDFYDRYQDATFQTSPSDGMLLFGSDAGFGLGNIHFPTAKIAAEYIEHCYVGLDLPGHNDSDLHFAKVLSDDKVNIDYISAIVRYLADYRFGTGGQPLKQDHFALSAWTLTDGLALWHAYRYGVNQTISPPYGKGFASVADFQNRNLDVEGLLRIIQPQENAVKKSLTDAIPIFRYFFSQASDT